MGKYLIKVESMDHDEVLDSEYVEGIECDGFVVLAHKGDGCKVMLHHVSIDTISDMIASSKKLMAARILAKAKVDVKDQLRQDEMATCWAGCWGEIDHGRGGLPALWGLCLEKWQRLL